MSFVNVSPLNGWVCLASPHCLPSQGFHYQLVALPQMPVWGAYSWQQASFQQSSQSAYPTAVTIGAATEEPMNMGFRPESPS